MSQPALSDALSRLRVLMDDPLFVARKRGVKATVKARQMINPVREALGIIKGQLNTPISISPAISGTSAFCWPI